MRYFLDTEFNGFGGALLSLALVPEDGGEDFYVTLICHDPIEPWVDTHVMPYLDSVPQQHAGLSVERPQAAKSLSSWLIREYELQTLAAYPEQIEALEIVADWPEDIAQYCMLLLKGPGTMVDVPPLMFRLIDIPGFSTAANSAVPHNALHDARSLRDHVLELGM